MIVRKGDLIFTACYQQKGVYKLQILHKGIGEVTGDFSAEEVTSIIEGLTDMLLQTVIDDAEKETKKNGED